jgi:hypothetical protein
MKISLLCASLAMMLGSAQGALAVCGDVTGDDQKTTTDALAVLRSAVGQNVNLVCDDGPSRLRYYNAFECSSGSDISTLEFNGYEFSADAYEYSPYEFVDRTSIDTFHVELCGTDYYFDGPTYLPRNRSIFFYVVLADPEVYTTVEDPAFLVLLDEGIPASDDALLSSVALSVPESGSEVAVFSGGSRRVAD